MKIWACGTVKRVADGLTDRASKRAQKVLPSGAVLWAWEADAEYDEPAGAEVALPPPQEVEQACPVRLAVCARGGTPGRLGAARERAQGRDRRIR